MATAPSFDAKSLNKLPPGAWVWENNIGFRRNRDSDGGSWYIKYRAPSPGHYAPGLSPPVRQVKERLPNCRNKSQAEGVLMARKAAIFEGTYQRKRKAEASTIRTFTPRFLETKRHLRTSKKYRQQLDQHIAPHFGTKPIEAVSSQDCLAYYNLRLDSDAAVSTVNGEMACLKSLFSEAMRAGIVAVNPAKGIKLINPNNVRDRILSKEETARLFDAAGAMADFVRPLFHVLFHTGMRLGEGLALEWADIEFEHERIIIRQSKSGEGRRIPLRQDLADELICWKPSSRGSRWVFPARHDKEDAMQSVRKGWLRLCKAAAIGNLRPHDLGHNFTSQLQAAGVSDSIIMSITGHKTHVMLHRYSHANDEHKRMALESLPRQHSASASKIISLRTGR